MGMFCSLRISFSVFGSILSALNLDNDIFSFPVIHPSGDSSNHKCGKRYVVINSNIFPLLICLFAIISALNSVALVSVIFRYSCALTIMVATIFVSTICVQFML